MPLKVPQIPDSMLECSLEGRTGSGKKRRSLYEKYFSQPIIHSILW